MRAIYLTTDDNTGNGDSRIDWYRVTGVVTGAPADEVHDATYGVTDDNTLLDGDGCPIVEGGQTYADVRDAIERLGAVAPAVREAEPTPPGVADVLAFYGPTWDERVEKAVDAYCHKAFTMTGVDPAMEGAANVATVRVWADAVLRAAFPDLAPEGR